MMEMSAARPPILKEMAMKALVKKEICRGEDETSGFSSGQGIIQRISFRRGSQILVSFLASV